MSAPRKKTSYPTGRAALVGALALGIGLPVLACLLQLYQGRIPHGRGSGSEVANGFAIFIFSVFAVLGGVIGAVLLETLTLIAFGIAWLSARRP